MHTQHATSRVSTRCSLALRWVGGPVLLVLTGACGAPSERANDDPRQCPAWGSDRLCTARSSRMLGCRTYFCPPYPRGVPQDLHEVYDRRVKALHERYGIPYVYKDVIEWARERGRDGATRDSERV